MVLLPTLRALTRTSGSRWHVSAVREGQRLAVTVAALPSGEAARSALRALDVTALRERLVAAHGSDAHLTLDAESAQLRLDLLLIHDDQSPDR